METQDEASQQSIRSLILEGAEIAGQAGSAAIGTFIGSALAGPFGVVEGAAGGAAVGSLLGSGIKVITDMASRRMSQQEEIRLAKSVFLTLAKLKDNVDAGRFVRQDGFFGGPEVGRSVADEIFEGVLLKCKNEHREKKLPFLCNIAANAPFTNISPDHLNHVINAAEAITYRQLCLVALVGKKDELRFDTKLMRPGILEKAKLTPEDRDFLMRELYQLGPSTHGLLDYKDLSGTFTYEYGGQVQLTQIGRVAFELMGLKEVPQKDLDELVGQFPTREPR